MPAQSARCFATKYANLLVASEWEEKEEKEKRKGRERSENCGYKKCNHGKAT